MKIAVIGSRGLKIDNLGKYLPKDTTEIILAGSETINRCARRYALKNKIRLIKSLPGIKRSVRTDPIDRNLKLIEYSDMVLAFWDGRSKGTKILIDICKETGAEIKVYIAEPY